MLSYWSAISPCNTKLKLLTQYQCKQHNIHFIHFQINFILFIYNYAYFCNVNKDMNWIERSSRVYLTSYLSDTWVQVSTISTQHTYLLQIICVLWQCQSQKNWKLMWTTAFTQLAIWCKPVFSERKVTFTFAICYRPSVCLSVTFVHPTQVIEIFSNVTTPFSTLAICDLSIKILWRSSQGNPSIRGLNLRGVAKYSDFWGFHGYITSWKQCKIGGKLINH